MNPEVKNNPVPKAASKVGSTKKPEQGTSLLTGLSVIVILYLLSKNKNQQSKNENTPQIIHEVPIDSDSSFWNKNLVYLIEGTNMQAVWNEAQQQWLQIPIRETYHTLPMAILTTEKSRGGLGRFIDWKRDKIQRRIGAINNNSPRRMRQKTRIL